VPYRDGLLNNLFSRKPTSLWVCTPEVQNGLLLGGRQTFQNDLEVVHLGYADAEVVG